MIAKYKPGDLDGPFPMRAQGIAAGSIGDVKVFSSTPVPLPKP
jgi:hypothetical protein